MIRLLTLTDIPQVARIHYLELPGFLSELGEKFLIKYYKVSLSIPEIFTFVEKKDEQILGFVSGIESSGGLYKKIISRDVFGFIFLFLRIFITHPEKLTKTVKTLAYPGFSSESPELLVISISKKYQRQGIGSRLFNKTIEEFSKRGINKFKISVYDRLSANEYYRKMGCRFNSSFNFLGEKMNYYIYHIRNAKKT